MALRYVDEATLSEGMRWVVRLAFPAAAILMPLAFFLSVLSPDATEPNAIINLAYVAGVVLAVGLLILGLASSGASDSGRGVKLNLREEPPRSTPRRTSGFWKTLKDCSDGACSP